MKLTRLQCVPRMSQRVFVNVNQNIVTRNESLGDKYGTFLKISGERKFSTSQVDLRDKSQVYNSGSLVIPDLIPSKVRKKAKRAMSITTPSQKFTESLSEALSKVYSEEVSRFKVYYPAGLKLDRYLKARNPPLEGVHLRRKEALVESILKEEYGDDEDDLMNTIERETRQADYNRRKKKLEKVHTRGNWVPVTFDKVCAFSYLLSRSSAEYAVLESVLTELKYQEPDFNPQSLFDFGSGLGTAYWASRQVFGKFHEVFCVDKSSEINDVAKNIILKGAENKPLPIGISFRLHTPSSTSLKYDLVMSAYSLMELQSAELRLQTVYKLWSRVEENGSLVLVELGTNAGFQIISEARDFILQVDRDNVDIVAPCPHTLSCPRYSDDDVPCNFIAKYRMFEIPFFEKSHVHQERFSYVVLKKGQRSKEALPRLVEEPIKSKTNYICRLCTQKGTLQEVKCFKKQQPDLYTLCKSMHWGDELPVHLDYPVIDEDARSDQQLELESNSENDAVEK